MKMINSVRKTFVLGIGIVLAMLFFVSPGDVFAKEKVKVKMFFDPGCHACMLVKTEYLPRIIEQYKDDLEIEFLNIEDKAVFEMGLSLEKQLDGKDLRVPAIVIGSYMLVGRKEIIDKFEPLLKYYIAQRPRGGFNFSGQESVLTKFKSFSALAVIGAGLIDGINPCAFTVLIFFISFLSLMGYRRSELILVGLTFICAVFVTYFALGVGVFRGLYALKNFHIIVRIVYYSMSGLCFGLALLNLRDFIIYKRTGKTDDLSAKLPRPVRQRINTIITSFYRKDKEAVGQGAQRNRRLWWGLLNGTFVVGVLVSLLEAVCTGQVYVPTIVFILKEPALRLKALGYLVIYNLMFVAPLFLILAFAVVGTSSKKIEQFFRERIGLVKLFMFILFMSLGIILLVV